MRSHHYFIVLPTPILNKVSTYVGRLLGSDCSKEVRWPVSGFGPAGLWDVELDLLRCDSFIKFYLSNYIIVSILDSFYLDLSNYIFIHSFRMFHHFSSILIQNCQKQIQKWRIWMDGQPWNIFFGNHGKTNSSPSESIDTLFPLVGRWIDGLETSPLGRGNDNRQ